MRVDTVGQKQSSCVNTVVKSTAVGAASGYALKYLWPLVKQENTIGARWWLKNAMKFSNNEKVEKFMLYDKRTPAQDAFIKLVEQDKGSKTKVAFSFSNIKKVINELGGQNSAAAKELKSIITSANDAAHSMAKTFMAGSCYGLKRKRPTVPFLVAGAGIGFITGFIHNVAKTDV